MKLTLRARAEDPIASAREAIGLLIHPLAGRFNIYR